MDRLSDSQGSVLKHSAVSCFKPGTLSDFLVRSVLMMRELLRKYLPSALETEHLPVAEPEICYNFFVPTFRLQVS